MLQEAKALNAQTKMMKALGHLQDTIPQNTTVQGIDNSMGQCETGITSQYSRAWFTLLGKVYVGGRTPRTVRANSHFCSQVPSPPCKLSQGTKAVAIPQVGQNQTCGKGISS